MKLSVPSLRRLLWVLTSEAAWGPVLMWRPLFVGEAVGIDFRGLILGFGFCYSGKEWSGALRLAEFWESAWVFDFL